MPKKGTKWAPEKKRPKRKKVAIRILEPQFYAIKNAADKKEWSVSHLIQNIIEAEYHKYI